MRAAVGHLELALLVAIGAGEAALHVAEELRLEERFRQAGAVDGHHRALRSRAALMDGVRDQLLADAALAGDEDLGVGSRDPVDFLRQLDDDGARPNQLFSSVASHVHNIPDRAPPIKRVTRPPRIYVLAFRKNSSRLRRLRSSIAVNTAPSPICRVAGRAVGMPLHLHIRGKRHGGNRRPQVRARPDRQLHVGPNQRAAHADVQQAHARPELEPALDTLIELHPVSLSPFSGEPSTHAFFTPPPAQHAPRPFPTSAQSALRAPMGSTRIQRR